MKKKIIMAIAIICSLIHIGTTKADAAPEKMADGTLFDAEYYAEHNPDVVKVYGADTNALYQHYVEYGRDEGRKANKIDQIIENGSVKDGIELSEEEFAKITEELTHMLWGNGSYWVVIKKYQTSSSDYAVVIESDDLEFDRPLTITYNIKRDHWWDSLGEEEKQKELDKWLVSSGMQYMPNYRVRLQKYEWYNKLSEEEQLREVLTIWARKWSYIPKPWETEEEWRQRLRNSDYSWYSDEYVLDYEKIFQKLQEELTEHYKGTGWFTENGKYE